MMSPMRRRGFTLLEIMLAVALLAVAMSVTWMCFSVVTTGWKKSQQLSDDISHADYVMEQLVMGLRSSYYTDAACGFWLTDDGDGSSARDSISWVKMGSALVGTESPIGGAPHRIVFTLDKDGPGEPAVSVKAWRLRGLAEDFDPDKDVAPVLISRGIVGFNCRVEDPKAAKNAKDDQSIEWGDEWEDTNRIPEYVELTLYMTPLERGEDPVEVKRVVCIPVAKDSGGVRSAVPAGGAGGQPGTVTPAPGGGPVTPSPGQTPPLFGQGGAR
jgi:prepilin-type N-terminal cleavage/methylation domain-containing protein